MHPLSPAPWSTSCSVSGVQTDHKIPPALSRPCCLESILYAPPFRLALGRLAFRACVCAAHLSPGETLRLRPHESMHKTQNTPWESCRAPLLRLIDTPSPRPLVHSSPSSSSPPASRHPASLPRLASFSRRRCPHPADASAASTPSWLAALGVPCFRAKFASFAKSLRRGRPASLPLPAMRAPLEARAVLPFVWNRLPWSPSTFRVPGRTREAFLMQDQDIAW